MRASQMSITEHYTHGDLDTAIRAGLAVLQGQGEAPAVDLLAGVDEFHIGGRMATEEVAGRIDLDATHRVLDIGCGLGGAARFLATRYGCRVQGIDLTPEFVKVGNRLNADLGLGDLIDLRVADATALPFAAEDFDRATLLHVGMNIPDKSRLMTEIARVLRPGGMVAIYDVMRTGDAALRFPVPWATDAEMSFVATPADYADALQAAGLDPLETTPRREAALAFFDAMRKRMAAGGPPPLGLHIVMARDAGAKVKNIADLIAEGTLCPVLMVARKPRA